MDLSIGYNLTRNLSLSLEGINITDATQRRHGLNRRSELNRHSDWFPHAKVNCSALP